MTRLSCILSLDILQNMEEPEEAFCVIRKYFGTNREYTVCRVKDIYIRDEQFKKFVQCTIDDLCNDDITFRVKIKDQERNRYIHVAIVKVTSEYNTKALILTLFDFFDFLVLSIMHCSGVISGTKKNAEDYIAGNSSNRGRGARLKVAKFKRLTPQIETSARKQATHRAAFLQERRKARAATVHMHVINIKTVNFIFNLK